MSSWLKVMCLIGLLTFTFIGVACASKGNLEETNTQVVALRDRIEGLTKAMASTQQTLVLAKDELAQAKEELASTTRSLDALRNTSLEEVGRLRAAQTGDLKFQRLITLFGLTNIMSLTFTPEGFSKTQDAIGTTIEALDDGELLDKWNAVAPMTFGAGPNNALAWDDFLGTLRERLTDAQK